MRLESKVEDWTAYAEAERTAHPSDWIARVIFARARLYAGFESVTRYDQLGANSRAAFVAAAEAITAVLHEEEGWWRS